MTIEETVQSQCYWIAFDIKRTLEGIDEDLLRDVLKIVVDRFEIISQAICDD